MSKKKGPQKRRASSCHQHLLENFTILALGAKWPKMAPSGQSTPVLRSASIGFALFSLTLK